MQRSQKNQIEKIANRNRREQKIFWSNRYLNWSNDEFNERMRINWESFEFILNKIRPLIEITPTKIIGNTAQKMKFSIADFFSKCD